MFSFFLSGVGLSLSGGRGIDDTSKSITSIPLLLIISIVFLYDDDDDPVVDDADDIVIFDDDNDLDLAFVILLRLLMIMITNSYSTINNLNYQTHQHHFDRHY
jgi:hypothetical protein